MNEDEEVILVSDANRTFYANLITAIIFFVVFLLMYSQAIVEASWFLCLASLLCFLGGGRVFFNAFKKKYYFTKERIIIADHRNEYVDEIRLCSLEAWNTDTKDEEREKTNYLVISSEISIVIVHHDYKNYDNMVNFFEENYPDLKDDKLKVNFNTTAREVSSKLEEQLMIYVISSLLSMVFLFAVITHFKKDSSEIQYFTGYIKQISISRKSASIELKNYSSIRFNINNALGADQFRAYNYNEGKHEYIHLNKK